MFGGLLLTPTCLQAASRYLPYLTRESSNEYEGQDIGETFASVRAPRGLGGSQNSKKISSPRNASTMSSRKVLPACRTAYSITPLLGWDCVLSNKLRQ